MPYRYTAIPAGYMGVIPYLREIPNSSPNIDYNVTLVNRLQNALSKIGLQTEKMQKICLTAQSALAVSSLDAKLIQLLLEVKL